MMTNFILQVTFSGVRKSISMDQFLYDLLVVYMGDPDKAKFKIRSIAIRNWDNSSLSREVQRSILRLIVRPSLINP